jgi:hypothetical protein
LATWLGPKTIGWYVTPADQPAMLSCQHAVMGAMSRLVWLQLLGMAVGAIVGLVLGIVFRRKKPPPQVTAPATAAPAKT